MGSTLANGRQHSLAVGYSPLTALHGLVFALTLMAAQPALQAPTLASIYQHRPVAAQILLNAETVLSEPAKIVSKPVQPLNHQAIKMNALVDRDALMNETPENLRPDVNAAIDELFSGVVFFQRPGDMPAQAVITMVFSDLQKRLFVKGYIPEFQATFPHYRTTSDIF